jgi:hypothetical protein
MDFPIIDLLDEESSVEWLLQHWHPGGLHCPHCQAPLAVVGLADVPARFSRREQAFSQW